MNKGYTKNTAATKSGPKRGYAVATIAPMKIKPQLDINDKDLPAIKDWPIGSKHTLTIEVEVTRLSKDSYEPADDGDTMHACLQVNSVGEQGKALKPTMDDEDEDEDD